MPDNFDLISVSNHNGMVSTTSLNIAEVFEKDHRRVLKDIRRAIETVEAVTRSDEGAKLPSPRKTRLVFAETTYTSDQGKVLPMYLLNRDATVFLIMSYTGTRAAAFKLGYIEAFDQMEENQNVPPSTPISNTPTPKPVSDANYEACRSALELLDTISDPGISQKDIEIAYIKGKILERLIGVNPVKDFLNFQAMQGDWVFSEPDETGDMHPITRKAAREIEKAKKLANAALEVDDSLYGDIPF